jgi:hypothetical protein
MGGPPVLPLAARPGRRGRRGRAGVPAARAARVAFGRPGRGLCGTRPTGRGPPQGTPARALGTARGGGGPAGRARGEWPGWASQGKRAGRRRAWERQGLQAWAGREPRSSTGAGAHSPRVFYPNNWLCVGAKSDASGKAGRQPGSLAPPPCSAGGACRPTGQAAHAQGGRAPARADTDAAAGTQVGGAGKWQVKNGKLSWPAAA